MATLLDRLSCVYRNEQLTEESGRIFISNWVDAVVADIVVVLCLVALPEVFATYDALSGGEPKVTGTIRTSVPFIDDDIVVRKSLCVMFCGIE